MKFPYQSGKQVNNPKCNQCDSLVINGVYCHETGCPNTNKVYDHDDEEWKDPEPLNEEE